MSRRPHRATNVIAPRVVLTQVEIQRAVNDLADAVLPALGENFILVPIMKAAMPFASDLLRRLPSTVEVEPVWASSYGGEKEPLNRPIIWTPPSIRRLDNRTVLILDTVFDHGNTMAAVRSMAIDKLAHAVYTCALLWKKRPDGTVGPDYYGHVVNADVFLIGYGLDLGERCRGLSQVREVVRTPEATA
jgi:hypoxanthine phosphoribosyltransferase